MNKKISFIKIGRIYWINPLPAPGFGSKIRPAIAIEKYDSGKTIFIHLGSSNPHTPSSIDATRILRESLNSNTFYPNRKTSETFIWIDASKPEWNTSIIKPHLSNKNSYIDIDNKSLKEIKKIYFVRKEELENIRLRRAQGFLLLNQLSKAKKQLILLKNQDPTKYKCLNPKEDIEIEVYKQLAKK